MKFTIKEILIILALLWSAIDAQDEKPTIGLALSGGGAKGAAHIGVLKVLEEAGIEVDYISGTSMGSFIGALYAIGYDADRIEDIFLDLDWNQIIFEDSIDRHALSIQEKQFDARYVREFPIQDWQIKLPKGLVYGHSLSQTISQLTWPVNHVDDFSSFQIPFLCLATDLETGEAVSLESGYLPDAIRASMSFPSVLTPVEIEGKLLADGGIVRNFPVQDLRDKGMDVIIGVDIGAQLYKKEELETVVNLMEQISSFKGVGSTQEQRELCNILITPDIEGYNAASFSDMEVLIENGKQAAMASIQKLEELAERLKSTEDHTARSIPLKQFLPVNIRRVDVVGAKKVSEKLVKNILGIRPPAEITPNDLEKAINRVYGSQYFEKVTYYLEPVQDGVNLYVIVDEKKAGAFKFGIHYNTDMKSAVLLNTTFRNVFNRNSRLSFDMRFGVNMFAEISYFTYSTLLPGTGFGFDYVYDNFEVPIIDDSTGVINTLFDYTATEIDFSIQSTVSNDVSLALVVGRKRSSGETIFGESSPGIAVELLKSGLHLRVDTRDQTIFPRRGINLYATGEVISDKYISNSNYHDSISRFYFLFTHAIPITKNLSLVYGAKSGIVKKVFVSIDEPYFETSDVTPFDVPSDFLFWIGGPTEYLNNLFTFDGFTFMKFPSRKASIFNTAVQFEPWEGKYIKLLYNWGYVTTIDYTSPYTYHEHHDRFLSGMSLTFGMDTPIGPLQYTLMKNSESSETQTHVSIGWWF